MISPATASELRRMARSGMLKGQFTVRWTMVFLMMAAIALTYCLRVNISVAVGLMEKELGWTETEKGYMLSVFYVGYSAGQVPSVLVAASSPKSVMGLGLLMPAVLSIFMPLACRYSFTVALVLRGMTGLFASTVFPAIFTFFSRWIPKDEKSLMIATTMSGMYIGEVVGFSLSGLICASDIDFAGSNIGRWPGVFFIFGFLGFLYVPIWTAFAWDSPEDCPYITPEELIILQQQTPAAMAGPSLRKRWGLMATSASDIEGLSLLNVEDGPLRKRDTPFSKGGLGDRDTVSSSTSSSNIAAAAAAYDQNGGGTSSTSSIANGGSFSSNSNSNNGRDSSGTNSTLDLRTIPWERYFSHPVALTCVINAWNFGWINFMMLSEMPAYLSTELGFNVEASAILSVVPYIAMFIAVVSFAAFMEYLQFSKGLSTKLVRHTAMITAFGGASLCLLAASYTKNITAAFSLVTLSQASLGAFQSGQACSYTELTPTFAPILNSVCNTFTALGGVLSPIFVAYMLESFDGSHQGWHYVFWYTVLQSVVALALWVTFFTGEVVPELDEPKQVPLTSHAPKSLLDSVSSPSSKNM